MTAEVILALVAVVITLFQLLHETAKTGKSLKDDKASDRASYEALLAMMHGKCKDPATVIPTPFGCTWAQAYHMGSAGQYGDDVRTAFVIYNSNEVCDPSQVQRVLFLKNGEQIRFEHPGKTTETKTMRAKDLMDKLDKMVTDGRVCVEDDRAGGVSVTVQAPK
jgi:hypothetical protein